MQGDNITYLVSDWFIVWLINDMHIFCMKAVLVMWFPAQKFLKGFKENLCAVQRFDQYIAIYMKSPYLCRTDYHTAPSLPMSFDYEAPFLGALLQWNDFLSACSSKQLSVVFYGAAFSFSDRHCNNLLLKCGSVWNTENVLRYCSMAKELKGWKPSGVAVRLSGQ